MYIVTILRKQPDGTVKRVNENPDKKGYTLQQAETTKQKLNSFAPVLRAEIEPKR